MHHEGAQLGRKREEWGERAEVSAAFSRGQEELLEGYPWESHVHCGSIRKNHVTFKNVALWFSVEQCYV